MNYRYDRQTSQPYPSSGSSGLGGNAPKQTHFYALQTRSDQDSSMDVVIDMLKDYLINFCDLLNPSATFLSFTPFVDMRFDIFPSVLLDTYYVSTHVCDSVVIKRVYRRCPISLSHRVTLVYFIEFNMIDFDDILGMDWLFSCYTLMIVGLDWSSLNFQISLSLSGRGKILCLEVNLFLT